MMMMMMVIELQMDKNNVPGGEVLKTTVVTGSTVGGRFSVVSFNTQPLSRTGSDEIHY